MFTLCKHLLMVALWHVKYIILCITATYYDYSLAQYNKTDLPKKTGQVAVITGGSRGIGIFVVKMLLQCDMEVVIGCRRPSAGEKAVQKIRESGVTTGQARVLELDNRSLTMVKKFADEVKKHYNQVHVLINNAGIMKLSYNETEDGFEDQWQVNYLSHFLLTTLMLPLLKAAGTQEEYARIINVSSCAHLLASLNLIDIRDESNFIYGRAYGQSKLAQAMFTKTLQDEFKARNLYITTSSVHPGLVNTELLEPTMFSYLSSIFKTPENGAIPIVYAAVSKSLKNNSVIYIDNCVEKPVNPLVHDSKKRAELFELSLKHIRIAHFFGDSL